MNSYGPDKSGEGKQEFGLPAIFDNVRDGLILVRFPTEEVVLFNRAASEMCSTRTDEVLGRPLSNLFTDPQIHKTVTQCAAMPVGAWPGHNQDVLPARIKGPKGDVTEVELHFCRVDDPTSGAPLVLLVMRPDLRSEMLALAEVAVAARQRVTELETKIRRRSRKGGIPQVGTP